MVGTEPRDVAGINPRQDPGTVPIRVLASPRVGLCAQRNFGVDTLLSQERLDTSSFVAFFDDDFRADAGWLEACQDAMQADRSLVGLTGQVLADGINGTGLAETDAIQYLAGTKPPMKHWASGSETRDIDCTYGCNMAFRSTVFETCRFDENLPLYGWQEDRDFSAQAGCFGRVIYHPECKGVHLGVSSGRVSGLRLGYSQIANAWYLVQKGTMTSRVGLRFVSRHLLANSLRSLWRSPRADYPGRLTGNLKAIQDLTLGKCHPLRAADL